MQTAAKEIGRLRRLNGAGLVWVAQYEKQKESKLPTSWKGEGANPIAVFTGGSNDLIHTILDVKAEAVLLIMEIWMLAHLFSKLMVRDG